MRHLCLPVVFAALLAGCARQAARGPALLRYYTAPDRAGSAAPLSDAVRVGDLLFLSGKLGIVPGQATPVPGGVAAETRQALENVRATLEANGSALDRVVKCTVFLASIDEWDAMNAVYRTYFPTNRPARTTVGGAQLVRNARVEIECVAAAG